MKQRLASAAMMIGLMLTGCGKDSDEAAPEGGDATMSDALNARAKAIEARADQSVKRVEEAAAADLKALQAEAAAAEASQAEQASTKDDDRK